MSPKATKEHILLATIDAIEKHGLPNLTTRLIAEEAGVNNAALHYYYGTKENLIDIAMDQTAYHMLGDIKTILEGDQPIEGRMRDMLAFIIEGVLRFPNIIRAHMIGPLIYSERQKELADMLNSWVDMSLDALTAHFSKNQETELRFTLNMLFSTIWMSGILAGSPEDYGWVNLENPDERNLFIDYAIDILFKIQD
jgi:TetR/AcrR family transcriptional regulator, regulator of cefoperazone and chloramphenicol sensitivity